MTAYHHTIISRCAVFGAAMLECVIFQIMSHMNEVSLSGIDTLSISKSLLGTQMTWIWGIHQAIEKEIIQPV